MWFALRTTASAFSYQGFSGGGAGPGDGLIGRCEASCVYVGALFWTAGAKVWSSQHLSYWLTHQGDTHSLLLSLHLLWEKSCSLKPDAASFGRKTSFHTTHSEIAELAAFEPAEDLFHSVGADRYVTLERKIEGGDGEQD